MAQVVDGSAGGIVDQIIAQQRPDVDAVSSAISSGKVICKAVENALLQNQP